ncbi:MAG TPA: hypothetical protein DDY71_05240 [Spirochaetia bacterium]|nr:hypothetical protein [Spirochaetia bacterium]
MNIRVNSLSVFIQILQESEINFIDDHAGLSDGQNSTMVYLPQQGITFYFENDVLVNIVNDLLVSDNDE